MIKCIIAVVLLSVAVSSVEAISFPVKTKQVCHKKTMKSGKEIDVCKTVFIHKKYQGTKVPNPPAKKK